MKMADVLHSIANLLDAVEDDKPAHLISQAEQHLPLLGHHKEQLI